LAPLFLSYGGLKAWAAFYLALATDVSPD